MGELQMRMYQIGLVAVFVMCMGVVNAAINPGQGFDALVTNLEGERAGGRTADSVIEEMMALNYSASEAIQAAIRAGYLADDVVRAAVSKGYATPQAAVNAAVAEAGEARRTALQGIADSAAPGRDDGEDGNDGDVGGGGSSN